LYHGRRRQHADLAHFLRNSQTAQNFIDGIDTVWQGVLPAALLYDRGGNRAAYIPGKFDAEELEEIIRELPDKQHHLPIIPVFDKPVRVFRPAFFTAPVNNTFLSQY